MNPYQIKQYALLHESAKGYGSSSRHAQVIVDNCRKNHWKTVLDFGCGKGSLTDALLEKGVDATGYDPAVKGRDNPESIKKSYDMVACIDVMEHCPPGTIKPELRGLRDMAKEGVLLLISCRPAHAKTPDGRNAHLSVHEPEWWMDRIKEVFTGPWQIESEVFEPKNKALTVFLRRKKKERGVENLEILNRYCFNSALGGKLKIAVVGNGPLDPEDKKRIEGSDYVIRFNDYNRRPSFDENSTQKCDMLFTQFDAREMEDSVCPKDVCIAIPSPFHQDRVIEKVDEWYWNSNIFMFNPYSMRLICQELRLRDSDGSKHPIPTVGFTMLWQLERWAKSEEHEIFVTGFTWHVDIESKTAAKQPLRGDSFPKTFNHSYLREVKWCAQHLIENPCFTFGEKTKQALYFVRWLCFDQLFEKNFHLSSQGDWRYDAEKWQEAGDALAEIRGKLEAKPDSFILDIGCGPRSMCEHFPTFDYLAVIDPLLDEYVKMGKSQLIDLADEAHSIPGEQFIAGRADYFNIVWCHNALDHCHDWRAVIRNIWRYLRKGGTAYIGTDCYKPRKGHLGIDYNELVKEIGALGFTGLVEMDREGKKRWIREKTFILTK